MGAKLLWCQPQVRNFSHFPVGFVFQFFLKSTDFDNRCFPFKLFHVTALVCMLAHCNDKHLDNMEPLLKFQ